MATARLSRIIWAMEALLLALASAALLTIAYLTYGRWLSRRVFKLREDAATPAVSMRDDRDYCPTKRSVVFGHHFTSIAGTGPIVGPAIAVMWGWLPAIVWVVFGAILIGAVHDLGSLAVSLRNRGRTVGDIAGDLLGPRVRTLFLVILIVALWIVLAIFGLVVAAVLRQYPGAIFPVLAQIPLALIIGVLIHRQGRSIVLPSIIALALMYASVFWGHAGPLHAVNEFLAAQATWAWVLGLLAYAYVASVLPVWTLLQPRDYINALQLITALGLLVAGVVGAALLGGQPVAPGAERPELALVAPVMNLHPAGAPPMIPVLFITIACGAISGFHCLVSSGTTSKQLQRETDAHAVGYGSMLTESFLATLVIIACAAGIGLAGAGAFEARYENWSSAGSLGAMVGAFVDGAANMIASIGVPRSAALALMGVLVASFASTTMDTACRLQRYVIQELARGFLPPSPRGRGAGGEGAEPHDGENKPIPPHWLRSLRLPFRWLATTHGATMFAVFTAAGLAFMPAPGAPWTLAAAGSGGLLLWPLFGATNQLLGGLAFIVIAAWLITNRRPWWFIVPPAALMLVIPAWALVIQAFVGGENLESWWSRGQWVLVGVSVFMLTVEAWMIVELAIRLRRGLGAAALEPGAEAPRMKNPPIEAPSSRPAADAAQPRG